MTFAASIRRHLGRAASPVRDFAVERGGASAIEFAMLSPLFFMLLFVLMQVALVSFKQHLLDNATVLAGRSLALGTVQTTGGQTAADFKRNYLCPSLLGLLDCDRVIADVRVTPNSGPNFDPAAWDGIAITGQDKAGYCAGSAGEYAFMRIAYPVSVIGSGLLPTSMLTDFKGERVVMLQSFNALRVEPVGVKRVGNC